MKSYIKFLGLIFIALNFKTILSYSSDSDFCQKQRKFCTKPGDVPQNYELCMKRYPECNVPIGINKSDKFEKCREICKKRGGIWLDEGKTVFINNLGYEVNLAHPEARSVLKQEALCKDDIKLYCKCNCSV